MYQTPDTVANEVLLARDTSTEPVLILEGDSDARLFRRFVNNSDIQIIPAWGKENVIEAVKILDSCVGVPCYLGIVDADFGHIDGSLPALENIVVTDLHDVEMMIIRTGAFNAVLSEMGSKDKVRKWPTRHGIRHELLQKTLIIGHLRHLSKMDDLNLRFEGLNFEKFVDRNSLEVDVNEMIRRVLNLRRIPGLFENDIRERLSSVLKNEEDDPYQICCGHDFVAIFAIALRKVLGSKTSKDANSANLGMLLRLAYDRSDFHRTELYSRAKVWSKRNFGYDIFA